IGSVQGVGNGQFGFFDHRNIHDEQSTLGGPAPIASPKGHIGIIPVHHHGIAGRAVLELRNKTGAAGRTYIINVHSAHTSQKEVIPSIENGLYVKTRKHIPQVLGIVQVRYLKDVHVVAVHRIKMVPNNHKTGHGPALPGTPSGFHRCIVKGDSAANFGLHLGYRTTLLGGGPSHQKLVLLIEGKLAFHDRPHGKGHIALEYIFQAVDRFDVVHVRNIQDHQVHQTVRKEPVVLHRYVHVSGNLDKPRPHRLAGIAVVDYMDPLVFI